MGAAAITRFLSSPAVDGKLAASTQNEALSALLFLYRDVWSWTCPGWTGSYGRSARQRLPVVLTRDEVRAVLQPLKGMPRLMTSLLYSRTPDA